MWMSQGEGIAKGANAVPDVVRTRVDYLTKYDELRLLESTLHYENGSLAFDAYKCRNSSWMRGSGSSSGWNAQAIWFL